MDKIILGKPITLHLPNGEDRNAQFAIVELDDIRASHDEYTFAPDPHYPVTPDGHNINDRNYEGDKQAQAQVAEYAHNLQPDRLISTSRTPAGTPIISKKGYVVSGNNRTMSLKRAVKDYPKKYLAYKQFLKEEIVAFGFGNMIDVGNTNNTYAVYPKEGHQVLQFKKPVLVRIDYDIPALNTAELAKYNMDTKKGKRPIDKAIELSAVLRTNPGCRDGIAQILSSYERLSDFYANGSDQKKVIDLMIKCSLVTEQEKPEYWAAENGFTQSGKQFLESVLASTILTKEALIASENDGVKEFRRVLVTSLPVLMANQTILSGGSLVEDINAAILLQNDMKQSGLPFASQLSQISAFGTQRIYSMKALYLNRLLDKGQRRFKSAIDKYNNSVNSNSGSSFFETEKLSPSDIFEKVIIVEAMRDNKDAPIEQKAIDNYLKTHLMTTISPKEDKYDTAIKQIYKEHGSWKNLDIEAFGGYYGVDGKELAKRYENMYPHLFDKSVLTSENIEAEIKTIQSRLNKKGLNGAEKELLNKKIKTLRQQLIDSKSMKKFPLVDSEGKRRIDNEALDELEKHLATLPQTKDSNFVNGEYTKKRKAFHTKLIEEMTSNNVCVKQDRPLCIFTGGAPGSGKSTFIKKHYDWLTNPAIFHVDADEVRAMLPEYKGWNAAITHEETGDIVNQLIDYIAPKECRFDVVIDGTFTNLKKYKAMIKKVQDLGYDTYAIFMHIAPEVSMKRAMERFQRSGRYVPRFVIEDVNQKGDAVFNELKYTLTGWVEVDGVTATIINSGGQDLPKDRDYGKLGVKPTIKQETIELVSTLEMSIQYLKKKKREETLELIDTLKSTMTYL